MNQSHAFPKDIKADLMTLRLATFNQILDPWVYILFRREMLAKMSRFIRKQGGQGSFFGRLSSLTKSNTPNSETNTHGTNGTPIPQRRHMIKPVRVSRESIHSKDEIPHNYVAYEKNKTIDETFMS
jgi:hypothetical protein